jgi:translocation and assembly module TamB
VARRDEHPSDDARSDGGWPAPIATPAPRADREPPTGKRPRRRWLAGLVAGLTFFGIIVALAVLAVLVLTNTDWGRERVRRYAEQTLNTAIHGRVHIGQLSGNLLLGVTAHDVAITDSAGNPFVAVEAVQGDYSVLSLLRKRIWIQNATVIRPVVVLDHPPDEQWNWQRIFPNSGTPNPSPQAGWGDWLSFTNSTVVDGRLIVRSPWHPRSSLRGAARDSAVGRALSGKERLVVERVPRGFQKVMHFDSIAARVPLLLLTEPGLDHQFAQISSASMRAYPFRPPAAVVRDVKGVVAFNTDSAWWKDAYAALPKSKATGDGVYAFGSGDLHVALHANPVVFADLLWVYPPLPEKAHGKLDLQLAWVGSLSDYRFTNTDIRLDNAHATGDVGFTLDDSISIHHTNVRFSGVETRTIEQVIPGVRIPRRGVFSGRASVTGGVHALALDGDVTFDDVSAGRSRIIAAGHIAFPGHSVRATNLRVQMLPMRVDMARTWVPTLPLSGEVTGTVTLNGASNRELTAVGTIDHRDRGTHSILQGTANVRLSGGTWFDVDVVARPVSLVEVGRFFPAAGLRGTAVGPIHLTGSMHDLRAVADVRLPDGGRFTTRGTFDLASHKKGYDFSAQLYTLNLRTLTTKAPVTSLTARVAAQGSGVDPKTMRSTIDADFATSRWDSIGVDTASVRATLDNGLVGLKRLYAAGSNTSVSASGTFGLTHETTGTITYRAVVDSLGALNRWIPRSAMARAPIAPRPRVTARAIQRAKADSARIDRATEMERMINGKPGPRLVVHAPKPVPADTLSGAARTEGTVRGNIYQFDVRGRASGEKVIVRGNSVHRFASEYAWVNARSPDAKIAVGVDADSVSAMGFAFDTVNMRATYSPTGGRVELVAIEDRDREYGVKGDYALFPNRDEARLSSLTFRFDDTTFWSMPRPASIRWGSTGVVVSDFELRDRENGRIYANGLLPAEGSARFTLDVTEFPVGNLSDILQTAFDVQGNLTLHATLTGTLRAPALRGTFALANGKYNKTVVPELVGRIGYADHAIVGHVDLARKNGQSMATVDGRVPINLALAGVRGNRLLDEEMSVDLVADSLPVELIPEFTKAVSNVHGRAGGKLTVRGTLRHPLLAGGFALQHGTMTVSATGATIDGIYGAVHMAADTVYVDSIAGNAKGPVHLRGTLAVASWSEPTFNLFLTSSGAELLHNDRGRIRVDAGLSLRGPFRSAYLTGAVTVTQGVIYAPEPSGRHVIGAGDPALFNVIDTAVVSDRELFPEESPLLANLRIDVGLSVRHNTWVRNREANVEVYTDDPVLIHAEQESFALTGVVTSDRGQYNFFSKRFQIKRGSATFIGSPELNPTLQLTGEYQVQLPSRGALNIRVLIGGTLRKPTLSLESDAQPPRTQSELLSLLAFGQSATTLLATGSSSIAGSAATSDLFGVGAQVAARRLAGVALGVAAQQVELEAGRAFGTDMFEITPTDAPSGNIVGNLFTQTRFEAGKYVNPRTFVTVQTQAFQPGAGIEHRTADGWQFNASISPRLLLGEPTLTSQPYRVVQTYGGFIVREWRF